jgi:hypothetical protein
MDEPDSASIAGRPVALLSPVLSPPRAVFPNDEPARLPMWPTPAHTAVSVPLWRFSEVCSWLQAECAAARPRNRPAEGVRACG